MNFRAASDPLFAVAVLTGIAAFAGGLASWVPFFRSELKVEDVTRLTPLDGLRGILCFSVMCYHSLITFEYFDSGVWQVPKSHFYALLGQSSVALFFCITAFLFWSKAIKQQGRVPAWPLIRSRLFRLAPLYLFGVVVVLCIESRQIKWLSFETARGLLDLSALGMRNWPLLGGVQVGSVNAGVTWSLAYEWAFYLALPALAPTVGINSQYLWLFLAAIFVLFGCNPAVFFFPGIIASYALQSESTASWCRRRSTSVLVLVSVGLMPLVTGYGYGPKALFLTTTIFVPIACGNTIFGLLASRGLRLMGLVSYSVYLLHGIILFLSRPMLLRAKISSVEVYWACCFGLASAALVISLFTYRWVEWPFIQFERRFRHHPAFRPNQPVPRG